MLAAEVGLPRVQSRREMLDYFDGAISPPEGGRGGRLGGMTRGLNTYMLESDERLPPHFATDDGVKCTVTDTGMDDVKILHARANGTTCEFFLDSRDGRFPVLHSGNRPEHTHRVVDALAKDYNLRLDRAWFYSGMLGRLSGRAGSGPGGAGAPHSGRPEAEENGGPRPDARGPPAGRGADPSKGAPRVGGAGACSKVRITSGSCGPDGAQPDFVQDDIHYDGYFAARYGKSVANHLQLVEACRDEYSKTIRRVESMRMGGRGDDDEAVPDGMPFCFEFPRKAENPELLISQMFVPSGPFRMWGTKSKIHDGYFQVLATDMHSGSPVDFEISRSMMRVYLSEGRCGNIIMRIFANLQRHYDFGVTCLQLG